MKIKHANPTGEILEEAPTGHSNTATLGKVYAFIFINQNMVCNITDLKITPLIYYNSLSDKNTGSQSTRCERELIGTIEKGISGSFR